MEIIETNCPECRGALEFPRDFDNVICSICGTAFQVRRYKDAISLVALEDDPARAESNLERQTYKDDLQVVESRLAELDEFIAEASEEVEAMKSRERSVPLQIGCSFFGLFMIVIIVIIAFMLLGRSYVGHWLFYLALALAVLLGLARIRQKLSQTSRLDDLRRERTQLEKGLIELQSERKRILELKATLISDKSRHSANEGES